MNGFSIAALCMASISAYLGIHYIITYIRARPPIYILYFAFTCLSLALYDIFAASLYSSTTPQQGGVFSIWQIASLNLGGICLLKYVSAFINRKKNKLDIFFILFLSSVLFLIVILPSDWFVIEKPSIKNIYLAGKKLITYNEMELSWIIKIDVLVGIIAILYMFLSLVIYYIKEHKPYTRTLISGIVGLLLGLLNDTAVFCGLYKSIYITEYMFLATILSISWVMSSYLLTTKTTLIEKEKELWLTLFAIEHDTNGAIRITAEGNIDYANNSIVEILGYTKEELTKLKIYDIWPSQNKELWKDFLREAKINISIRKETYLKHKNSNIVPVEVSVTYVSYEGYDYIYMFVSDISARKKTEIELRRLFEAVNQAAETIMITDRNGVILFVNPAFEKMTGYSAYEVIGKTPAITKSGKHPPKFYEDLWNTISSGKTWSGIFTNKRKDGQLFEEEAVISPVKDRDGNIVCYVAVKRDVTYELQLENQIRQSQKMAALGHMAHRITHTFTNSLVSIVGNAQLARKHLSSNTEIVQYIDEIIKAADKVSTLTAELLAFAHPSPPNFKKIKLKQALAGLYDILKPVTYPDVNLIINHEPCDLLFNIDANQLEHAIIQICINAVECSPKPKNLEITTCQAPFTRDELVRLIALAELQNIKTDKFGLIRITDDGPGIPPENIMRIFDPFFTTKDKSEHAGLGLSIAYKIIESHKGIILVNSEIGRGTTFRIYIPAIE